MIYDVVITFQVISCIMIFIRLNTKPDCVSRAMLACIHCILLRRKVRVKCLRSSYPTVNKHFVKNGNSFLLFNSIDQL